MARNKNFNKRITYVIIAILCLTNFFLGASVIKKLVDIKITTSSSEVNINEDAIAVFNVEGDREEESLVFNDKIDNKTEIKLEELKEQSDIIKNEMFLKLLISSNAYMKTAYQIEYKETEIEHSRGSFISRLAVLLKPDFYIKPHLPAIVSAFNDTYFWEEKNKKENTHDLEGYIVLSDIIFIEDSEGRKEFNQELELMGKKHEDKLYIESPKSVSIDHENPYILIYHTHGTEAYLPITTDRFHTENREYNVLAIGEIIGNVLEANGHKIKWIDTYHDIPSYNESYINSLASAKEELNKNESIKVILDVHRDGIETNVPAALSKAEKAARITINEKNVATFSLVIGPNNPNKEQLIKFANYIRHTSESMYPGLFKGIIMKQSGKFNQFLSDYYVLIEVGSNLNTIDEAMGSAKYIGEIMHKVIEGIEKQE
ncbi:MAG: stage II sporulation protein P [Tissierellales bacterium]